MTLEVLGLAVLLALGCLPFLLASSVPAWKRGVAAAVVVAAAAAAGVALDARRAPAHDEASVTDRPIEDHGEGYVGSESCRPCHPREHGTWADSYHARMTQLAGPDSVLGDFDDVTLQSTGRSIVLRRRGDAFFVRLEDGTERPIVMTTGSHHMQAYWYPTGDGRVLGQLPFIWLLGDERWAPRNAVFLRPQGGPLDETRRWNITCNKCHATHARPHVADLASVDTRVTELGIACEACHGPGGAHVRANRDPVRRYALALGDGRDDTIVNPHHLDRVRASHVCAQCHALFQFVDEEEMEAWKTEGYRYRPGDLLTDTRFLVHPRQQHPALAAHLRENPTYFERKFWPDGMIRMAGREMIAMLETPCFTDGDMSCLSCHRLHQADDDDRPREEWADDQLGAGMRGIEACVQCHEEYRSPAARAAHAHHEPDSAGSNCYDCHMPRVAYGLAKAIRTHHLESPSVVTSVRAGRPLACNQCHLNRTLAWSAKRLSEWYGHEMPPLSADEESIAASILWIMRGDATQRALTAWTMGWDVAQRTSGDDWQAPFLAQALNDPYEVVRLMAYRSLRTLPGFERFPFDFVGTEADRVQAFRDAARVSQQASARRGLVTNDPAVLIGPGGRMDTDTLERLTLDRDDRVIELDE